MKNTFIRLTLGDTTYYLDANRIISVTENKPNGGHYDYYNSVIKVLGEDSTYAAKETPSLIIAMINKAKEDVG